MSFNWRSISGALVIIMVAIELWIQLQGLMGGDAQRARLRVFEHWGLYVGSPIYTYFTYAFIHGFLLHLVMNMFVTIQFAPHLERDMGHVKFVAFTALAAILCGMGTYWFLTQIRGIEQFGLVGFSGVIFAYIGAFFRVNLDQARDKWRYTKKFFSVNFLLLAFIFVPLFFPSLGISGEAHLFGALFGFSLGNLFLRK